MGRILTLTFLICFVLWPIHSVWAQHSLITPFTIPESIPLEAIPIYNSSIMHNESFPPPIIDFNLFDRYPKMELMSIRIQKPINNSVNLSVFKALYNKPKPDEKELIREQWRKAFGIDVWYPYYKAKEVEKWVKKRLSVKIFSLKGEPKFAKDQFMYSFKSRF